MLWDTGELKKKQLILSAWGHRWWITWGGKKGKLAGSSATRSIEFTDLFLRAVMVGEKKNAVYVVNLMFAVCRYAFLVYL